MSENQIGIAKIFRSIQGEGSLSGIPMVFVRTAGCSVGCPGCDTNYKLTRKLSIEAIISEVQRMQPSGWVWITGGEPTDWIHLDELKTRLHFLGYHVAIATSGIRIVNGYDFISVSPHSREFAQKSGDQLNVVPGLNGFDLEWTKEIGEWAKHRFRSLYVTPLENESPKECIDFVLGNSAWRLGNQSHKQWNVE